MKKITAENYLDWADLYHTKLEQPPIEEVILSYAKAAGDGTNVAGEYIEIPSGYGCVEAKLRFTFRGIGASHLKILIGISGFIFWTSAYEGFYTFTFPLDNEQIKLPISIWQANSGYSLNVEVFCKPTKRAFEAWQINAITQSLKHTKT